MTRLRPAQREDLRNLHGRISDADHESLTRLAVLIATRGDDDMDAVRELTGEYERARRESLERAQTGDTPARLSPDG